MTDKSCILFFVKYPQAGSVKKRLAVELGAEVAAQLYRCFVEDALHILQRCGCHILICFYPPRFQDDMPAWLGFRYQYLPQRGLDLGQRMKSSFFDAFALGFEYTIAVGSDIPDLPSDFIRDARASLKSYDVVLGPAGDGGYYLIGFRRDAFLPEAFEGPRWGTDTVFAETRAILGNKKLALYTLPYWNDVDSTADLKELYERNRHATHHCSKTMSYLSAQGLLQTLKTR